MRTYMHMACTFLYTYKNYYFNQCKSVKCISLAYFLTKSIGAIIIMGQIFMISFILMVFWIVRI